MLSSEEEDEENKKPKIENNLSNNYEIKNKIISTINNEEQSILMLKKINKFGIKIKEIQENDNTLTIGFAKPSFFQYYKGCIYNWC